MFEVIFSNCLKDPVTNIRDITIKKVQKGLQSNRLPIYYMAMFALVGLDQNRERKARVKKICAAFIQRIRLNDAKHQQKQLDSNVPRSIFCRNFLFLF